MQTPWSPSSAINCNVIIDNGHHVHDVNNNPIRTTQPRLSWPNKHIPPKTSWQLNDGFNPGTHELGFESYNVLSTQNHNVLNTHDPIVCSRKWWNSLNKNENWDDATLNLTMDVVEGGNKIQIASYVFGVHVTSLTNNMYGITQSHIKGKFEVLQKG